MHIVKGNNSIKERANYEVNIFVNKKFSELFPTKFICIENIFIEVKIKKSCQKSLTFDQTCDLLSIHKQTWLPALRKRIAYEMLLQIPQYHGGCLGCLWIGEERNVLSVDFQSAEKNTRLRLNTCYFFPMGNSTQGLHVNFGQRCCQMYTIY